MTDMFPSAQATPMSNPDFERPTRTHTSTTEPTTQGDGGRAGDYCLTEACGRGGFGTVYRAYHRTTGAPAAVKVLHPHLALSELDVARFAREARVLARLEHANIVRLIEVGKLDQGVPYIVMEWASGVTLERYLDERGPLDATEAFPVLEKLCQALHTAHERGVIHRDLKTENVMVCPARYGLKVKLLDFGLAKLHGSQSTARLTSDRHTFGSLLSISPEQLKKEPLTRVCDIYALGVLMYRMFSGRFPHRGANPLHITFQRLCSPPPKLAEEADIPPAIAEVVDRCLQIDPADRPQTALEVLHQLRGAVRRPETR